MATEGVKTSELQVITVPLDNDIVEVARTGVNNFQITWANLKGAIFTMDINVAVADGADETLGAKADAEATTDTGTWSVMSLLKRAQTKLTGIAAKLPALVGGKIPVDVAFPATQPVSGTITVTGVSTSALQTSGNALLTSIDGKTPSLATGSVPVETVKQALVSRQLAAGVGSVNTPLTTTARRVSLYARGADVRFAIGSAAQTALATSHFIAQGERLEFAIPATPNIAVIRDAATDGVLELTELS